MFRTSHLNGVLKTFVSLFKVKQDFKKKIIAIEKDLIKD